MSKDLTKARRAVSAALDAAFKRSLEQELAEGELVLDIHNEICHILRPSQR